jgi:hypothetical protein
MTTTRDEEEINRLAQIIAEKTVHEMLTKLGIDASSPDKLIQIQKDFAFLRGLRQMYADTASHGFKAMTVAILLGIGALIWTSIKTGKAP